MSFMAYESTPVISVTYLLKLDTLILNFLPNQLEHLCDSMDAHGFAKTEVRKCCQCKVLSQGIPNPHGTRG